MNIKFENSKFNRKALQDLGYIIYDPHCTFCRKAWIIIGDDGKTLYGVDHRNKFKSVTISEFLKTHL